MTEALLFDYNGVITDDEEQHRASFAELLAEVGIPLSRDQYYAEYLGCDDRTAFVDVFRRAGKPLDAPTLEALVARKSQIYTRLIGAAPVLVPGVADFVRAASGRFRLGARVGAPGARDRAWPGGRGVGGLLRSHRRRRGRPALQAGPRGLSRRLRGPGPRRAARPPPLRGDRRFACRPLGRARGRDALRDAHDQPSRRGARRRRSGVDLVRRARPGGADPVGGRVTGTPAPPPPPPPPPVARLEPGTVSPALVTALYTGAVMSRADAALITLTGPGAVTCAQGLLTNDLEQAGEGSFVYGALLTPKGMIVVDAWAARLGTTVGFTVPADGRDRAVAIFTRSVPPRLARLQDHVADVAIYRLAGPRALAGGVAAGLEVPPATRAVLHNAADRPTARATEVAAFALPVTMPVAQQERLSARLSAAAAIEGG